MKNKSKQIKTNLLAVKILIVEYDRIIYFKIKSLI